MIRTLAMTGALAAAMAVSAAQAQPMGTPPGPMHGGMGAMGGPMMGAAMPSMEYVRNAAQSDEYEIQAAQMALQMSRNPRVRTFAKMMIRDHTKSTMMIHAALRRSGQPVPPPPPLKPEQQQMISQLQSAGPNFDRMYVDQQVQAHEMALRLHQAYAQGGNDPALRDAAMKIVPVVQMHLDHARALQSHMG